MKKRSLSILGSTGSIGASTLKVVDQFPERFSVIGLVGGNNLEKLGEQVKKYQPAVVATRTAEGAEKLKILLGGGSHPRILSGTEGAEVVAADPASEYIVSAIVGAAGLRPTVAAVKAGKVVALANKESLVVAGALVRRLAATSGARLFPVDSEHSAIFQSLADAASDTVRRLILTASGGPFFLKPEINLDKVEPEEALQHPNWSMGPKITIDSATMMNKGLELIEAHWLFGFSPEQLDVIVHPQSIVHSMVEYLDGSVIAQMGVPDMRGPIAYALTYPERLPGVTASLNLPQIRELTFFEPDHQRFPAIELARHCLAEGETFPAVLNGANEVAVQAFLDHRITFVDLTRICREVLLSYREGDSDHLEAFMAADTWGRTKAEQLITSSRSV